MGDTKQKALDFASAAIKARGEGRQRAQHPEWSDRALAVVAEVASRLDRFTADDVWHVLKEPAPSGDPRALGAVLQIAARQGICRRLPGEYRESRRRSRHKGPVQVWASIVFVGA